MLLSPRLCLSCVHICAGVLVRSVPECSRISLLKGIPADGRVDICMLQVSDGVTLARKK